MSEQTYVCCHAPSLALLLFETVCTSKCQRGLLLGTIKKHIETSSTDEKEASEEKKTVIYIEHCVPITDESMFSSYGELRQTFYENYISQSKGKIIGWYTYRRNVKSTRCTLLEGLIHRSLLSNLENAHRQTFLLALLSASSHETLSTHSFSQTFLRLNERNAFEHIRLKIYNLSDKVSSNSGYLRNLSFPLSESFEGIAKSIVDEHGVRWVKKIQKQMALGLVMLNENLLDFENRRARLEAEITAIRMQLNVQTAMPDHYTPSPRKEKLPVRFMKYDPELRYGANRPQNLMEVSDDENDNLVNNDPPPPTEAQLREMTESLLQSEGVQRVTHQHSYAEAIIKRPSPNDSGGGDMQSPRAQYSNSVEK